ncbi:2TM domain-containing protein [Spongiivirga sp. MCCC 1A20706]|uniref:2TM domain-containing protein n=1 Tax=Spongiivirga sp. MCCC 1A20706 TaxID=3160963 RepID=UPI0039773F27
MKNYSQQKLERARKRVKDLRGFYSHVLVYIIINIFIAIGHYIIEYKYFPEQDFSGWSYLTTPIGWGIGLLVHGLWVHRVGFSLFRNWEQRKIEQLMKEDQEDFENYKG